MRMKKYILIALVFVLISNLIVVDAESLSERRVISGIISLPAGETAPMDGYTVGVYAMNGDVLTRYLNGIMPENTGNLQEGFYLKFYSIPEGSNSVPYTLEVPFDVSIDGKVKVGYSVSGENSHIRHAFYAENEQGMTINSDNAANVDLKGTDLFNIDITVLKGIVLTVKINIPASVTLSQSVEATITAFSDNGTKDTTDDVNVSEPFIIKAGSKEVKYSIPLPYDTKKKYILYYAQKSSDKISDFGYYSIKSKYYTAYDEKSAGVIDLSSGVYFGTKSNIDFSLLPVILYNKISGKISLPYNLKAPKGGVSLAITAYSDNNTSSDKSDDFTVEKTIVIPEGSNSAAYSVDVQANLKGGYWVSYKLKTTLNKYAKQGWYNAASTVTVVKSAKRVDVSKNNISNVNMVLAKTN